MKKLLSMTLAILAVAAPAIVSAQNPTVALLSTIELGALGVTVSGVAANGPDAYVVTFTDRRVLKVTDAVTTAASSAVLSRTNSADSGSAAPLVGTFTWAVNRGLISADFRDGKLLVAGQANSTGDRGVAALIDPTAGTLLNEIAAGLDGGANFATASACFTDADSIFAGYTSGTNYFALGGDLQSLQGSGFVGGPNDGAISDVSRDMVATTNGSNQSVVFIAYNTAFFGPPLAIGLHRLEDTNSNGVINSVVGGDSHTTSWFTTTPTNDPSSSITGTAIFEHTASSRRFVALANRGDGRVILVNFTNPSDVVTLDISASAPNPGDIAFTTVGGNQYMLVTETTGATNRLYVFGIDGAALLAPSGVDGWTSYQ